MMASERAIRIEADGVRVYAVLSSGPTADAVWDALPIQSTARRSGEEIVIEVGLTLPAERNARAGLSAGELGYRPGGKAIALVFGPGAAPAETAPGASSPVNVFGRITGDASRLGRVREGGKIRLTRIEG